MVEAVQRMTQTIATDVQSMIQAAIGLWQDMGLADQALVNIGRRPNPPNTDASGEVDYSYTAVYSVLKCQIAVEAPGAPNMSGVIPQADRFVARQDRHLLIDGYYPLIQNFDVADVTVFASGVTTRYQIKSVESDSMQNMTRLALELVTQ
jgi:hypothetical protein